MRAPCCDNSISRPDTVLRPSRRSSTGSRAAYRLCDLIVSTDIAAKSSCCRVSTSRREWLRMPCHPPFAMRQSLRCDGLRPYSLAAMLTALSIRNIVLIEALDLAFGPGLGVLTGETGRGQVDPARCAGPGARQPGRHRAGARRRGPGQRHRHVRIRRIARSGARALDEAEVEIEPGEPLIIRRRLKADGGSKAFVNDQPVGVALLRELAGAGRTARPA